MTMDVPHKQNAFNDNSVRVLSDSLNLNLAEHIVVPRFHSLVAVHCLHLCLWLSALCSQYRFDCLSILDLSSFLFLFLVVGCLSAFSVIHFCSEFSYWQSLVCYAHLFCVLLPVHQLCLVTRKKLWEFESVYHLLGSRVL